MKPTDPRVTALATAIVALLDGLAEIPVSTASDELVPLTPEALAERQFEHRSIVRLAEKGELRTVKIGRRRYTRASWLAELGDKLFVEPSPHAKEADEEDELLEALRGCRRR